MKMTSGTANDTDGLSPNCPFLFLGPEQLLDVFTVRLPLVVRVCSHPAEMTLSNKRNFSKCVIQYIWKTNMNTGPMFIPIIRWHLN